MPSSVLSNTAIATGGRVINIGLGLVATGLITRLLGAENFGLYTLTFSYGVMFQLAADMGLYLTLTRKLGQSPDSEAQITQQITALRLVLLLIAFTVALALAAFIPKLQPALPVVFIAAIGLSFQSLSQLLMGVFQARASVWRATAGDLIGRAVQITAILFFTSQSLTVLTATVAFSIGAAVAWVAHKGLNLKPRVTARKGFRVEESLRRRPGIGSRRQDPRPWLTLLRESWPLGTMLVLNAIYFRTDILILGLYRPEAEVGLYGLSYRLIESALFFPAMFGGLLLPKLASGNHRSQWLQEGLRFLSLIAVCILVVLIFFAEPILVLIAGASFAPAAPLLRILSIALAIMFIGNLFGFSLVALKQQVSLMKLYATLAIFNVAANFVFIPQYGAPAAAWTTVATEFLAMTVAGLLLAKLQPFSLSGSFMGRLVLVGVITAAIAWLIPASWPIVLACCVIGAVFLIAAIGLNLISKQSLQLLRSNNATLS